MNVLKEIQITTDSLGKRTASVRMVVDNIAGKWITISVDDARKQVISGNDHVGIPVYWIR